MAKVISLSNKIKPKIEFEKAGAGKKIRKSSDRNQLDLFSQQIKVVDILSIRRPFDIAMSLEESDPEKAMDLYKKAIEISNFPDDASCNLGILYYKMGKQDQAMKCFKNALKLNPSHFEAHYNMANLYFDMGNLSPAMVHYEIAGELQPDFPNTFYNLGLLQAIGNQITEAIRSLEKYKLLTQDQDEKANELIDNLNSISKMGDS